MDQPAGLDEPASTQTSPLRLVAVRKCFGRTQILNRLHLELRQGEMLALLGPSGSGKTTILRLIAGFERPDAGHIFVTGHDMAGVPPYRRGVGMIFQDDSLFAHLTVAENVAFGLRMKNILKSDQIRQVRQMLQMVRLEALEDRYSHQLSGGQQQRVALARALATAPSLLLLDEPLGALDKNLRESMQSELREIQRKLAITSILVTHDQEEALTMSDRIAVLTGGEIVQIGHPTDIYQRPKTRFVAEFLGQANIFTGQVKAPAGRQTWSIALDAQHFAEGLVHSANPLIIGQPVTFAVRPERLILGPAIAGSLRARVHGIVFRGAYFAYELSVPGQTHHLVAYAPDHDKPHEVGLTWLPHNAVILQDPRQP